MDKHATVQYILDNCIIAIIRADTGGEELVKVIDAVARGGVRCIELTMTTPGALRCLEIASKELAGADVLLGVGSVLDPETCRMAILAGAQYVVTPITSPETIRMAQRYGKPIMSGAYTPTEIVTAWDHGSDFVKVFPADVGGPKYLKAIKGPLPQIPLIPTGGVNLDTMHAFLEAGASALGVGGNLVGAKLVQSQNYDSITANARAFVDALAREHR